MAEEPRGDGHTDAGPQAAQQVAINAQYIKDLSFENPRAPRSLFQQQAQPQVEINFDVNATSLGQNSYEVVLTLNTNVTAANEPVFLVELAYGAVVTVPNATPETLAPILLVEVPRIIFPFARAVIATATRDGGFPPLMINPIDFTEILRRKQAEGAAIAPGPAVA